MPLNRNTPTRTALACPFRPASPRLRNAAALGSLLGLTLGAGALHAQVIPVPNYSFESQLANPAADYTTNNIDDWQTNPQPANFTAFPGLPTWAQQTGIFANLPPAESGASYIPNADGNQVGYLFDTPGIGFFQDNNSTDWQNNPPTHAFNSLFQIGKSYTLTIGVLPGGGEMQSGAVLDLILYFRDTGGNMVTVADTPVTFEAPTSGSVPQILTDYSVSVPDVTAGDPEAGQYIGIALESTAGEGAGYWDVDNVRLTAAPEPASFSMLLAGVASLSFSRRARRQRA